MGNIKDWKNFNGNNKLMGAKGEEYIISPSGSKKHPHYILEKPDGSLMIDMTFDYPEEAKKYAKKKGLIIVNKDGEIIQEDYSSSKEYQAEKDYGHYPKITGINDGNENFRRPYRIITELDNKNYGKLLRVAPYIASSMDGIFYLSDNEYSTLKNITDNLTEVIKLQLNKANIYIQEMRAILVEVLKKGIDKDGKINKNKEE